MPVIMTTMIMANTHNSRKDQYTSSKAVVCGVEYCELQSVLRLARLWATCYYFLSDYVQSSERAWHGAYCRLSRRRHFVPGKRSLIYTFQPASSDLWPTTRRHPILKLSPRPDYGLQCVVWALLQVLS